MKVLMINQADEGGGAEKIALNLARELNGNGIQCDLYVDYKNTNLDFVYSLERSKIKRLLAKLKNKLLGTQSKYGGSKKLTENLISKYDIIHIHNFHGNYLNLESLLEFERNGIPIIWTLHDIWPLTGRCCIEYECEGFKKNCGMCGKTIYSYPKMLWDNSKKILTYKKNILKNLEITFVSPSNFLYKKVQESFLKKKDIRVIENGIYEFSIDEKKEKLREKYGLKKNKKYLLLVAAILSKREKGMQEAIEIINKISINIGVITIGKGISKEHFIGDREIVSLGYLSDEKIINEIFEVSDIYLNPTKADNFPTTNLEAFRASTPVFANSIGGNLEQINESNGWLFDIENIDESAKEIERLMMDKLELSIKSRGAKQTFLNKYRISKMTEKYIDLYKEKLCDKELYE